MSNEAQTAAHDHEHFIVPLKNYLMNACAIAVLMAATIIAAEFDLGPFNPVVALTIAVMKAVLIILFFMNTYYNSRLTWIFVALSFFWLMILFGLFLPDYFSRDFPHQPNAWASSPYAVPSQDLPMDQQVVHGDATHGEAAE